MPLYLTNTKGQKDHRLIKAASQKAAEDFFLGKRDLETRTITDVAEGAELAAEYKLEKADEPAAPPPPPPPPPPPSGAQTEAEKQAGKAGDGLKD